MNPYFDQDFFSFFHVLFFRMIQMMTGELSFQDLASDEIQCFALGGLGISSALVGSFLVFRKMTMLANSLSHTILLGVVLAYFFGSNAKEAHAGHINLTILLIASVAVALITVLTTEFLTKVTKLQEDASIGIVFSTFFALGILLVNLLTRNAHIGAEVVMGNVDALHQDDLIFVFVILCINCLTIFLFYRGWMMTTFDAGFASSLGFSPQIFNYGLMILVAFTLVGSFRAVGVLMILTFLTAPVLIARLMTKRFSRLLFVAALIAALISFFGVALTRHVLSVYGIALSTAGVIVTFMGTLYLIVAKVSISSVSSKNTLETIDDSLKKI